MIYKNALIGGEVTDITVEDGRIVSLQKSGSGGIDLKYQKVFPGLIDVHTHGCMGIEANGGDIAGLAKYEALHGTTSFLPTTATVDMETVRAALDRDIKGIDGANVLGFHIEGPYIAKSRKGAQDEKYIRKPDINEYRGLKNVKMVTIAPETEGALDFIEKCDAICSIGHTDCDYETAAAAIEKGARCLTHTFNAMPPMLHRAPGPIGAAIEKRIYAQLICDGIHVQRGAVWSLYRALGADRVCLISDSIAPAGLPYGEYTSGGLPVTLSKSGCRLADGTLAGSTAFLLDCVKTAIGFGIPENDAFCMAGRTPAKLLGINKGELSVGFDADFIVLDNNYNLLKTVIGGIIYE